MLANFLRVVDAALKVFPGMRFRKLAGIRCLKPFQLRAIYPDGVRSTPNDAL